MRFNYLFSPVSTDKWIIPQLQHIVQVHLQNISIQVFGGSVECEYIPSSQISHLRVYRFWKTSYQYIYPGMVEAIHCRNELTT